VVEAVLQGNDIDRRSLEDRVYAVLRSKILSRELTAGTVLTIRHVAAMLEVSPTPARDALRRLQADGLVVERGRHGAEVIGFSSCDISDLFGVRGALETYAVRIVMLQPIFLLSHLHEIVQQFPETFEGNRYTDYGRFAALDADFHKSLIRATGNERLLQTYQALHVHIHLARIYQQEVEQRAQANHQEHVAIVHALEDGDVDAAALAVGAHIDHVRDHILRLMGPGNVVI